MNKKFNEKNKMDSYLKMSLIKQCPGVPDDNTQRIHRYWKEAENYKEFKSKILNDSELQYNRGYAILSKRMSGTHFQRLRSQMDPYIIKKIPTKKGYLKIFLNGKPIYLPNNSDMQNFTDTRLCFANKDDLININMFHGYMVVEGEIGVIYQNDVLMMCNGKFQILWGYSFIMVKEIHDDEFVYTEE